MALMPFFVSAATSSRATGTRSARSASDRSERRSRTAVSSPDPPAAPHASAEASRPPPQPPCVAERWREALDATEIERQLAAEEAAFRQVVSDDARQRECG